MAPESTNPEGGTTRCHEDGHCGEIGSGHESNTPVQSTQSVLSSKRSFSSTAGIFEHRNSKKKKTEHGPIASDTLNHINSNVAHELNPVYQSPTTSAETDWTDLASFSSYDITSGNIFSAFAASPQQSNDHLTLNDIDLQFLKQLQEELQPTIQHDCIPNLTIPAPVPHKLQDQGVQAIPDDGIASEESSQKENESIGTVSGANLKPWKCDSCSKLYKSYDSVERHWKQKHTSEGDPRIIDIVGDSPRRPLSRTGSSAQPQRQTYSNVLIAKPQYRYQIKPGFNITIDPALCAPNLSVSIPTPAQTPEPVVSHTYPSIPATYNSTVNNHDVPATQVNQNTSTIHGMIPGDPDEHRLKIIRTAGGKGGGGVSPVIRKKLQPLAAQGLIPPLPTAGTYHRRDRTLDYNSHLGTYVRGHAHEREMWDATNGRWKSM